MRRPWRICATWNVRPWARSATSRWPATARRCGGIPSSLNHIVGPQKDRRRYCDIERLRSLQIDEGVEFCRLFDRQITRLCALQNIDDVLRGLLEVARNARAKTHQAAGLDVVARGVDRRQPAIGGEIDDGFSIDAQHRIHE